MPSAKKMGFETYIGYKPSAEMLANIHSIVEECTVKYVEEGLERVVEKILGTKLEEAVRKILEEKWKSVETEVVELKKIPKRKALEQIKAYIDQHQGCLTSDVIYDLSLDPDLVLSALKELEKDKVIRGEKVE